MSNQYTHCDGIFYYYNNNLFPLQGFKPENSPSQNVAAWNVLMFDETPTIIYVDNPGIFEINNTLWIASNTTIYLNPDCIIKKASGSSFSHIFANRGILSGTRDNNISLFGNGAQLDINGIEVTGLPYRMRGQINFLRVDTIKIDGFKCNTILGEASQFMLHVADINNFKISNIHTSGLKDSIHINGLTHDGDIEDIYTDNFDDALALLINDFIDIMPVVGDIYNINIRRWTDQNILHPNSEAKRICSGSWQNWTLGNTYNKMDLCVNVGNIYLKVDIGAKVAANAPVHTSGDVTGGDGITWRFFQIGTATNGKIKNITFQDNNYFNDYWIVNNIADNTDSLRSCYPGTGGNGYSENIVYDNIKINGTGNFIFWIGADFTKSLIIKNSVLNINYASILFQISKSVTVTDEIIVDEIKIDNCNISINATSSFLNKPNYDSHVNLYTINNSVINFDISRDLLYIYEDHAAILSLVNSTLNNFKNLFLIGHVFNFTINASYTTFHNFTNIINHTTVAATGIVFNANHCTFENPVGTHLFKANIFGLSINISNSSGIVSKTKIAEMYVDVIACDLFTLGAELIDQANWYKAAYWDTFPANWSQVGTTLSSNGNSGDLWKNDIVTESKTYLVSVTITRTAGTFYPVYDGAIVSPAMISSMTHHYIYTESVGRNSFYMTSVLFNGTVTALSVKEIL
jgi:hypothetical protein